MKNIFYIYFILFFCDSCAQEIKETIPFYFTKERHLISVPLTIKGIGGNFLFDTGSGVVLALDTLYAEKIEPFDSVYQQQSVWDSGAFASFSDFKINYYQGLLNVKIGNHSFEQEHFSVGNYRKELDIAEFDGVFSLPNRDSINVWEVNFLKNHITIIPYDDFQMDNQLIQLPLKWDNRGMISTSLPISIQQRNGENLQCNNDYLIDTGSISDITFLPDTKEAIVLNEHKDSAFWLWNRHFWESSLNICGKIQLDSARVYVYDLPSKTPYKRIIGLNFLKRFIVYFDLKNDYIYLKPIHQFERLYQGIKPWGKYTESIRNNRVVIDYIADYSDNPAKKAGLQVGDEIISINGIELSPNHYREQEREILSDEIWNYVVRRKGKILNLTLLRQLDKLIKD
jgi:predicted aspartyl protease